MYELNLLGFAPLLLLYQEPRSLSDHTSKVFQLLPLEIQKQLLQNIAAVCQVKQLQVVLSPDRI